jgi:hypothetical protein
VRPDADKATLKSWLLLSAFRDSGDDARAGAGKLDVDQALRRALGLPPGQGSCACRDSEVSETFPPRFVVPIFGAYLIRRRLRRTARTSGSP